MEISLKIKEWEINLLIKELDNFLNKIQDSDKTNKDKDFKIKDKDIKIKDKDIKGNN